MNRLYFATLLCLLIHVAATAQELAPNKLRSVRKAAVEVHLKGQLRGGGAFVHDSKGKVFVLTAAHLFRSPKDTCTIVTEDDESYIASLSAYNLGHDLALLEVPPEVEKYGSLSVANAVPPDTQPIFNLGPALRRRTLILSGNVADSRTCYTDFSSSKGYIGHFFAAGISPVLTSGGIWVNHVGEVVGVQHGRLIGDQGAPSSGLSMVSLPSAIKALIRSNSLAETPGIGGYVWEIWTADRSLLEELPKGTHGLIVNPVIENRPLAKAGIKAFDVILSCEGVPLKRRHQLLSTIRAKPAGTVFTLQVITPGSHKRRTVEMTTDSLEALWE